MTKKINYSLEATHLMQLDIAYRAILRIFEAISKHDITDSFELSTFTSGYRRALSAKNKLVEASIGEFANLDITLNEDVSHYAFARSEMREAQRIINALLNKGISIRIHNIGSEYIDQKIKNEYIRNILIPVEASIQTHIDPRQSVSSFVPGGNNYGIVITTEEYDESVLYHLRYTKGRADGKLRIKNKDGDFILKELLAGDDLQEVFDEIFEDKVSNTKSVNFPNSLRVNTLINNRFRDMPEELRKTLFITKAQEKQQRRLYVNTVITEEMLDNRGYKRGVIDEYLKTLNK